MTHAPLILRPGDAADHALVKDAWARTYARHAMHGGPLDDAWCTFGRHLLAPDLFHSAHRGVIDLLLERSGLVVGYTHDHAPEVIAAWCAFEWSPTTITLHYAWTRVELRGRGYAATVVRCAQGIAGGPERIRASHWTRGGQALLDALQRQRASQGMTVLEPGQVIDEYAAERFEGEPWTRRRRKLTPQGKQRLRDEGITPRRDGSTP